MGSALRPSDARYRPDIDGLRAIAVLAVAAFHVASSAVPGGFAGVDIFFVISGFLITRIILREIAEGRFSYLGFYARRIRRIFPALIVVIVTTMALGWWILLPDEYAALGRHALAGSLFSSNILLWLEAGYFDTDATRKPFLHLWSLGVEEQFYIFWPILLGLVWRLSARPMLAVGVMALLSFAANLALVGIDPSGAFYLPFTRFWELLAGGLLAIVDLRRGGSALLARRGANVASVAGLVLCAGSIALLSESHAFPGWYALAPVAGAALLIAAGPEGVVNRRLLSLRPMVYVGLVSYPLYLWHWPLLSLLEIVQVQDPAVRVALEIGAVAVAFAAAAATYHLVESPLARDAAPRLAPRLAAAMVLVAGTGMAVSMSDGFARARGPWNLAEAPGLPSASDLYTHECATANADLFRPGFDRARDFCIAGRDGRGGIVVIGDSHANRLSAGLSRLTQGAVSMFGRSACLPALDIEGTRHGQQPGCSARMRRIAEGIREARPSMVVLHGYFHRAYTRRIDDAALIRLRDGLEAMLAVVAPAAGEVVILLGVPELAFHPSRCIRRPLQAAAPACTIARSEYEEQQARTAPMIREIARSFPNVRVHDPAEALCSAAECDLIRDGRLLFSDTNHLSIQGAEIVARDLLRSVGSAELAKNARR